MVLVPGLLCNFGWEVTIKIHYSTVSGGGSLQDMMVFCLMIAFKIAELLLGRNEKSTVPRGTFA